MSKSKTKTNFIYWNLEQYKKIDKKKSKQKKSVVQSTVANYNIRTFWLTRDLKLVTSHNRTWLKTFLWKGNNVRIPNLNFFKYCFFLLSEMSLSHILQTVSCKWKSTWKKIQVLVRQFDYWLLRIIENSCGLFFQDARLLGNIGQIFAPDKMQRCVKPRLVNWLEILHKYCGSINQNDSIKINITNTINMFIKTHKWAWVIIFYWRYEKTKYTEKRHCSLPEYTGCLGCTVTRWFIDTLLMIFWEFVLYCAQPPGGGWNSQTPAQVFVFEPSRVFTVFPPNALENVNKCQVFKFPIF